MNMDEKYFLNLNLHDSIITELLIDKKNENSTNFTLTLDYVNDYESYNTVPKKLVFSGCYKIAISMNTGIIAPESISIGEEILLSDLIKEIGDMFKKTGVPFPNNLRHFRILTSSTSSLIDIVSGGVELIDF
jgi:hypothetical protein